MESTASGSFWATTIRAVKRFAPIFYFVPRVVGAHHVALGLDYVFDERELADYLKAMPETFPAGAVDPCDFVKPEQLPEIVAELVALGYDDADLVKILGGNLLRVARAVWK